MDTKRTIDRQQRLIRLAVMAELQGRLERAERLVRAAGLSQPAGAVHVADPFRRTAN